MVSRGLSGIAPALRASILDHRPAGRREAAGTGIWARSWIAKLMVSSTMADLPETARQREWSSRCVIPG